MSAVTKATVSVPAQLKRVFKSGTVNLPDPDPNGKMSPQEVMALYANTYPMLNSTTIKEPVLGEDGETIIYEFVRPQVQTKG